MMTAMPPSSFLFLVAMGILAHLAYRLYSLLPELRAAKKLDEDIEACDRNGSIDTQTEASVSPRQPSAPGKKKQILRLIGWSFLGVVLCWLAAYLITH